MELLAKSDEEILSAVDQLMDNLMQGSTEIDHAKHTKDFSSRIKERISPEQLADALDRLLVNKCERSRLSHNARQTVLRSFTLEDSTRQLLQLILH